MGGVLLAAGGGRRFGEAKALARLGAETLGDRGARMLLEGGCAPVVVVIGAEADRVRRAMDPPDAAEVIENPEWASGMSTSLRAGLGSLDGRCEAAVIALADQPLVHAAAISRLIAAWREGARAAVATYAGAPRNPVLLAADLWPAVLERATGDEGARSFLRDNPSLVRQVPCDDVAQPDDVDTPADLTAVASALPPPT